MHSSDHQTPAALRKTKGVLITLVVVLAAGALFFGVGSLVRHARKAAEAGTIGSAPVQGMDRIKRDSKEYIKINVGELYLISGFSSMPGDRKAHYVFRGIVYRDSELADEGVAEVTRATMVCCAADTVPISVKVPLEMFPEKALMGTWVNVYGSLESTGRESDEEEFGLPDDQKVYYIGEIGSYRFRPEYVEFIDNPRPEDFYIYQWTDQEPYNY